MSAGAICWFESGLTDSIWGAGFQTIRGLGFVSGACSVHYHSEAPRRERLHELVQARAFPKPSVSMTMRVCCSRNGRIAKVVSWRRGATAYRVVSRDGRVVEEALDSESIRAKRV